MSYPPVPIQSLQTFPLCRRSGPRDYRTVCYGPAQTGVVSAVGRCNTDCLHTRPLTHYDHTIDTLTHGFYPENVSSKIEPQLVALSLTILRSSLSPLSTFRSRHDHIARLQRYWGRGSRLERTCAKKAKMATTTIVLAIVRSERNVSLVTG